jgi:tRNA (cmo5U34)-methyltransferase
MSDVEWNPETYLAEIVVDVPGYPEFEEEVAAATDGLEIETVLELGTGTGETARRVLARHPGARWTGIDASEPMLAHARETLAAADLRLARLEDPIPDGPFDLVVSALAVHHLDGAGKRDLFRRVAAALGPGGCFVLGDVVVPERPEDAVIEIDGVYDLPDTAADQLAWLEEAGLEPELVWARRDLAVLRAWRR